MRVNRYHLYTMTSEKLSLDTHEGFVWNYARITAKTPLEQMSPRLLAKSMLSKEPPKLGVMKQLPLNLPRYSPGIISEKTYSGTEPHVYVSNSLTTNRAASAAAEALWSLVRHIYLSPHHDKADLSEWLDDNLAFSLVFASGKFLSERIQRNMADHVVCDATFTPSNPTLPLAFASTMNLGYP